MTTPDAVVQHYTTMQRASITAVQTARRAWDRVDPADLSNSWAQGTRILQPLVEAQQVAAATAGASYVSEALAQAGDYVAPDHFLNPAGFAGTAADGRPLQSLLYSPVTTTKTALANGASMADALVQGRGALDMIAVSTVADAGRAAAGVNIATRAGVGYTRHLNPPSCSRCAVLAGKWYRWNAGFRRHPRCDCIHVPALDADAAKDAGLILDPYEYFHSLTPAQQAKYFGKAEAQAINDGADLFQVVNARRGMKPGGLTTEGTSRAGWHFQTSGSKVRLTPEAIYQQGLSREETLNLLGRNGYLVPGGQNPLGGIIGQREGFGQMGRGGTRVAASRAVLDARATGQRVGSRATMTAQERRMYDAEANWQEVLAGRNPYGRGPLEPGHAAQAEAAYRKALAEVKVEAWTAPRIIIPEVVVPEVVAPLRPPVPTAADGLTYESTLHWSEDKLYDSITKYADDPEAVDRILAIIDQRAEAEAAAAAEREALQAAYARQAEADRLYRESKAAQPAPKVRQQTVDERVEEQYAEYVATQYSQALDFTNGNFFNKRNQAAAQKRGLDSYALFTGPYRIASKYASEELQAFWQQYGRETLGSFRYQALNRVSDRKAAEAVRAAGLNRGRNAVANRADRLGL